MTTAYTSLLGLALPVQGELTGVWGDTVNNSITSLLDTSVAGTTNVSTDTDVTLTTTTGAANTARQAILLFSGARTALRTVTAPAQSKIYTVINATTGGFSVKLVGSGPTTGVTIVAGESAVCAWNGSDFVKVSNAGGSASFTNVTVSGTTTLSGLTASTALALDASKNVVSVTNTGTGNNVLSASPTLTGTIGAAALTLSSDLTLSGGTANGVAFLNGSKVVTSGSALTFDGTNLANTGNITAGTTGSGANLVAYASTYTSNGMVRLFGTDGNNKVEFGAASATTAFLTARAGVSMIFGANDAEGMRLTSTGLGIGTSSPSAKLHIGGNTASTQQAIFTTGVSDSDFKVVARNGVSGSTAVQGYIGLDYANGTWPLLAGMQFIRNSTSGELAFTAGATTSASEQMRLTSTGLGIGTSSPAVKLEVVSGAETLRLSRSTSGSVYLGFAQGGTRKAYLESNNADVNLFAEAASSNIIFGTVGAERVRIDSSGNLGIGTSSPAAKLHVSGDAIANTFKLIANTTVSGSDATIFRPADNTMAFSTNGAERMRLDSSGNLGLGVTPSAWDAAVYKALQISTNSSIASFTNGETRYSSNCFYNSSTWKYITSSQLASAYTQGAGAHTWFTAPSGTAGNAITFTQAMTLDASAQLQIGTTTASGKVTIDNTGASTPLIYAKSADQSGARIALSNTGSGGQTWQIVAGDVGVSNSGLSFYDGTATRVRIDSSGQLLIGVTSLPSAGSGGAGFRADSNGRRNLYLSTSSTSNNGLIYFSNPNGEVGSITVSGSATAYNTSSDYRLKNITGALTGYKERLMSLQPKQGTWKADGSEFRGFLAHEFAEPYSASVTGEKDAVDADNKPIMQAMQASSSEVMADLVALVKEQQAIIESLKARLDAANL